MITIDNIKLEESWQYALSDEFQQPYFSKIIQFLHQEEQAGNKIFPSPSLIFNAFNSTPFKKVKVVILGQDPYHNIGQACGLSFSVPDGFPAPPSLKNIFKELNTDIGMNIPTTGNLQKWANQGILLLNAGLTVRAHQANSHKNIGWHKFTDAAIVKLSDQRKGIVFLLWGGFAKKKSSLIDHTKHHVLMTGHPSPLSANRGYWFGNKHFSKTNELLAKQNLTPIDWHL
ncbi:uracil-DNA glycosylase [bacterium]|nr:uracil-DNA glycosylase [bacterium]MDC3253587.1 uracil-DNA glycosylase [bacterium]MDG1436076.1 uracil-DNA glycosylase [Saprospiraceae bacterium]